MALLVVVAAMVRALKIMGHDSAYEFNQKTYKVNGKQEFNEMIDVQDSLNESLIKNYAVSHSFFRYI